VTKRDVDLFQQLKKVTATHYQALSDAFSDLPVLPAASRNGTSPSTSLH
jgi:hypothetical protein